MPGNYTWAGRFDRNGESRDIDEEGQVEVNEALSDGTEIPSYIWSSFTLSGENETDVTLDGMFWNYTTDEMQDTFPESVSVGTQKLPARAQMVYTNIASENEEPVTTEQNILDNSQLQLNLLIELPEKDTDGRPLQLLLEYRSPALTADAREWGQYLYQMLTVCSEKDREASLKANEQLASVEPKTAKLDLQQKYRVAHYHRSDTRNGFSAVEAGYDFRKSAGEIINGKTLTTAAPKSLDGQLQYSIENHRVSMMIYPKSNWVAYTSDYYKGGFYLSADEMKQLTELCDAEIKDVYEVTEDADVQETTVAQEN